MESRDTQRGGDLVRYRGDQLLVLAPERLGARALDAEHADALLAELQRHAQDGLDVRRTVEARIGLRIGDVLQLAVLDHPPADADTACEQLPDVGLRRADRRAHDQGLVLVVERQQEAVLVAHRLADDPKQAPRELVDVEHRADLRRQPLEDRELPSMRVRGGRELLEHPARAGNVRHVLLFDRADAAEIGGAVLTVAVDDAEERVDDIGMELRPAAPHELGARELDALRLLVGAPAHDDLERVGRGDDVRLDRDRVTGELLGVAGAVEALVVRPHDRHEVAQRLDRREDRPTDRGVGAHDHPLVGAQRAGLVQDRVRHADLADVVQQRTELDATQLVRRKPHLVRDRPRERGDPRGVAAGVWIARVDRGGERLHRREVELAHLR